MEVALSSGDVAHAMRVLFLAGIATGLAAVLVAELIPATFDPAVSPLLFALGALEFAFIPFLFYFLMRGLARHLLVTNTFVLLSFFFSRVRVGVVAFLAMTLATLVLCVMYPDRGLPYALYGAGLGIILTLVALWNELVVKPASGAEGG
jgi:hypothetical protein